MRWLRNGRCIGGRMATPIKFQNPNSKEMQSIKAKVPAFGGKNGKKTWIYFVFIRFYFVESIHFMLNILGAIVQGFVIPMKMGIQKSRTGGNYDTMVDRRFRGYSGGGIGLLYPPDHWTVRRKVQRTGFEPDAERRPAGGGIHSPGRQSPG